MINPPSQRLSCDVDLVLSNKIGTFEIFKEAVGPQTEYKVVVQDPKSLGIVSYDRLIVDRASQDLVLACDLVLQHVGMSLFRLEVAKPSVMMAYSSPQVIVKETEFGESVQVHGTGRGRAEVSHITIGTKETFDESRTVQVFKQLAKSQRFSVEISCTPKLATLTNALHEYEAGMASLDRLLTFKHVYNVLELITNIDGTDRDGYKLDAQMVAVSGASQVECEAWRNLYNRTKHFHRSSDDVKTFVTGLEKLTEYLPMMRRASGKQLCDLVMAL